MSILAQAIIQGFKEFSGICVVYDDHSPLARLITQDIQNSELPIEYLAYSHEKQQEIREKILNLPEKTVVVMIQSTRFRLSPFRFRLDLFEKNLYCLELPHLQYIPEEEHRTFLQSLQYEDYTVYERYLSPILQTENTYITSSQGNICVFGPTENIVSNDMEWHSRDNKGGTLPAGEVFTECKDLSSVNGVIDVIGFPHFSFAVEFLKTPCSLTITNGKIESFSHAPESMKEVLQTIQDAEGEILVREIGMGLNKHITIKHPIRDINACERMMGYHLSLGKKHTHFRKKLSSKEIQKYHIDFIIDVENCSSESGKPVFKNGEFISNPSL